MDESSGRTSYLRLLLPYAAATVSASLQWGLLVGFAFLIIGALLLSLAHVAKLGEKRFIFVSVVVVALAVVLTPALRHRSPQNDAAETSDSGDAVVIPPSQGGPNSPPILAIGSSGCPSVYTTRDGDTIDGIARDFRVSAAQIMLANGVREPRLTQSGERIVVPCAAVGSDEPFLVEHPGDRSSVATIVGAINACLLEGVRTGIPLTEDCVGGMALTEVGTQVARNLQSR